MKEYSVKIIIKNNFLKQRMENAGFDTIISFCRSSGVQMTTIMKALSFKLPLYNKWGKVSQPWVRISDFLNCDPEDLVPEQHRHYAVKNNVSEFEADMQSLGALSYRPNPQFLLAQHNIKDAIRNAMGKLTKREEDVLKRVAIDGESLDDVAKIYNVTRSRIAMIRNKAISKMKHPSRGLNKILLDDLEA